MNTRVLSLLLFTLVSVPAMLFWFNFRAPVQKPPSVAKVSPAPPQVILPLKEPEAAEPQHYRPKPVTAAVRRQVNDFLRRYKDMAPEELAKQEGIQEVMDRFTGFLNTPEMERKLEERLEAIKAAKGGEHGTLNITTGNLDSPEGRAWLEALFSEDAQMIEDYIMNKLDGAIFELAFDPTLEQTSNGVTVKGGEAPAPAENKLPD